MPDPRVRKPQIRVARPVLDQLQAHVASGCAYHRSMGQTIDDAVLRALQSCPSRPAPPVRCEECGESVINEYLGAPLGPTIMPVGAHRSDCSVWRELAQEKVRQHDAVTRDKQWQAAGSPRLGPGDQVRLAAASTLAGHAMPPYWQTRACPGCLCSVHLEYQERQRAPSLEVAEEILGRNGEGRLRRNLTQLDMDLLYDVYPPIELAYEPDPAYPKPPSKTLEWYRMRVVWKSCRLPHPPATDNRSEIGASQSQPG